ncbi:MAG: photosystem assembly BtpA [Thermomicrobiales bacterium]|jgi:membrane complex biogenesis BtpA family protein|nr:photosystem assembly BtpA [Thermomicrobiales bacterium]
MASNWLSELTGANKPIIGMVHLPALPGTPLYDTAGGMQHIRDWVARDLVALQAGGIDAVMFCNENDRPYRLDADVATVAAMADAIASTRSELSVPFGVNVLWDPRATLAVAAATGAAFAREIFTGAFAGDFGIWVRTAGDAFRYRREIGAENVRLLFNINAEFAAQVAPRPLPDVARSVVFSSMPDALCVSGPITSQPADASNLADVARAVKGSGVPVLVNTGCRAANAAELLQFADGAVVGSSLKVDGVTWNPVDEARVRELMERVKEVS